MTASMHAHLNAFILGKHSYFVILVVGSCYSCLESKIVIIMVTKMTAIDANILWIMKTLKDSICLCYVFHPFSCHVYN